MGRIGLARIGASIAAGSLLLMLAGAARGTVTGGCTVTGTASVSSTADVTTAATWHLRHNDLVSFKGQAPTLQNSVTGRVVVLGIGVPVFTASGEGDTQGESASYDMGIYSSLARVIAGSGSSSGPSGGCEGSLQIVFDDVNPLLTVAGGGAAILAAVMILGIVALARRVAGVGSRALGVLLGAIAGFSIALVLTQTSSLDPASGAGWLLPALGAIAGAVLPGQFATRAGAGPTEPGGPGLDAREPR